MYCSDGDHLGTADPIVTAPGEWRWQKWTHVAICHDGAALVFFVDGTRVDRVETSGPLAPSEELFYVGADPGRAGASAFFKGSIDEVRLSRVVRYREAFTPAAVYEPDADTLLLLHFDETIRGLHPDASGQQHHGRAVGHPRLVVERR